MVARAIDPDLYKDKIEVSLDGRQIFTLFFGGAVVASLLFVLGVMVGRRLEARSHVDRAAATSAVRDPLAALDRLAEGKGEMTFPDALGTSGRDPAAEVERALAALKSSGRGAERDAKSSKAEKAGASEKSTGADRTPPASVVAKDGTDKAKDGTDKAKTAAIAEPTKSPADAAGPVTRPEAPVDAKAKKGRFTLQLSAFQSQAEADAFRATVKAAGYAAYVTTANIDGKGTYYRVRAGSYADYEAAVAAKAEFERKVAKIAYVTRL